MVDQQTRLEVLAVVGEVQAEQFGVAAGRAEAGPRSQPHQIATERDRDVAQHGVLAQRGVMRADVHGVVGPVGDRNHRQPRGVADDEFDVVGVGSAAALVDDDDGLGQLADPHLQMSVSRRALTGAGDRDLDRLPNLGVLADGDDRRAVERRERLGGNPVGWAPRPGRAARRRGARFPPSRRGVRSRRCVRCRWHGAEPSCRPRSRRKRGEPPDLVAAVRHLEGVDIERREDLALGPAFQSRCQVLRH